MKNNKLRKLICIILIFITLSLFCITGCDKKRLKEVKTYGNYTIQQEEYYVCNGDEFSLTGKLYSLAKEYNLKTGEYILSNQTLLEHNGYVYILCVFDSYKKSKEYYRDALFARAPLNNPTKIEIIDTIKQVTNSYDHKIFVCDDKVAFQLDTKDYCFGIYELNTLNKINFNIPTDYKIVKINEHAVLARKEINEHEYSYLLFDYTSKILTLKNYSPFNNWLTIYKNYLINSTKTIVVDFLTDTVLNEEETAQIIEEYDANNKDTADDKETSFNYNGKEYNWHTNERTIQSVKKGNTVTTTLYDLVITEKDSETQYLLTAEDFAKQAEEVVTALRKNIECKQIFSENGELYLVYYNYTPSSMFRHPDTTLPIVFKYEPTTNSLLYIGYGTLYNHPITHIYKENIIIEQ